MQGIEAESPVLIIASLLIALQVCWIGTVLRRNHRRRLAEPLSGRAFQHELKRIFAKASELS